MSKRLAVLAVALAAVIAVVAGGVTFATVRKTVTVSLDGKPQTFVTYDGTVGDVLESKDIDLGAHDNVTPAVDTKIREGTRIAVAFGRRLTLEVDGTTQVYWTTATSVDEALDQLGQRYEAGAEFSTSRSSSIGRGGLALTIRTPKKITLVVGRHKAKKVKTTGVSVGEALVDLAITTDDDDIVRPAARKDVTDGIRIVVKRVATSRKSVVRTVPYATVVREDADMYEGEIRVEREGQAGTQRVAYRITKVNGKLKARKVLRKVALTDPVTKIEFHGTKPQPVAEPNFSGGNTVWDQLAQCESGGNWGINTGNGYSGGLQFLTSTWLSNGGGAFAPDAYLASREQQIVVAERIRAATGGYGAWPACASGLGLL